VATKAYGASLENIGAMVGACKRWRKLRQKQNIFAEGEIRRQDGNRLFMLINGDIGGRGSGRTVFECTIPPLMRSY